MRFKTWPVAALGLGSLLLLIVVSMLASSRKAQDIYTQLDQLNTHHHDVDAKLRRLRSDVQSVRHLRPRLPARHRARARTGVPRSGWPSSGRPTWRRSRSSARWPKAHEEQIRSLQTKLDDYWETFDPLFDWTPTEKIFRSASFLRREVVPRREAVLAIAQEIEELNNANLAEQRAEVTRRHAAFRDDLAPAALAEPAARPRRRADGRLPAARARAAIRRAAGDRRRGRAPDARALAAAGRHAGGGAEESVARAARSRRAGAHRLADGARPDRADAGRPPTRGSARPWPNASSSSTACSARSAISRSACGPACSTTSVCSRRSNGTCATSRAATASTSS